MIYKNEKWIIDNWDNIFPDLLDKVIQFGYDSQENNKIYILLFSGAP